MPKILLPPCGRCYPDPNKRSKDVSLFSVEIRNDGSYEATCSKGHKLLFQLQHRQFEILFEMGAIAIIDGYHREAVANFAGALEKFFEFYVHFVLLKFCTKPEVFQDMWKLLGNYSERQLGAFFLAYALDTGEDPPYVGRKPVEFRNRVVHKGYIPTREETIEYGAEIGRFIWPVLERIKSDQERLVKLLQSERTTNKTQNADFIAGVVFDTILSTAYEKPKDPGDLATLLSGYQHVLNARKTQSFFGLFP